MKKAPNGNAVIWFNSMYSFFHHIKNSRIFTLGEPESNLYKLRRFNKRHLSEFSNLIIALFLLLISIRIGSIIFFIFTDLMNPQLAYALEGIKIPKSSYGEKYENHRFLTYLTIYSNGEIKYEDYKCNLNELYEYLKLRKSELPNTVVCIVADKECVMEDIDKVLIQCSKADTRVIWFLTMRDNK